MQHLQSIQRILSKFPPPKTFKTSRFSRFFGVDRKLVIIFSFILRSYNALMQYLPNHIATYIPIVITCLATPILFISAFRQAETSMQRRYARYTTTERRLIDSLKVKFVLIVSVFYLCWMPNLVNGLILWTSWNNLPMTWIVANWYLMVNHFFSLSAKPIINKFDVFKGLPESTSRNIQHNAV